MFFKMYPFFQKKLTTPSRFPIISENNNFFQNFEFYSTNWPYGKLVHYEVNVFAVTMELRTFNFMNTLHSIQFYVTSFPLSKTYFKTYCSYLFEFRMSSRLCNIKY